MSPAAADFNRAPTRSVILALALTASSCAAAQSAAGCPHCPEMVRVPAGEFTMGSPPSDFDASHHERPQRHVQVKAFEIARFPVTYEQWDVCVRDGGCAHRPLDHGWGRARRPVVDVSWLDAQQYVRWLNSKTSANPSVKTGGGYRLPTEAEWEYAARGRRDAVRYWGDIIGIKRANCDGCGSQWDNRRTAPVGAFAPNPFGLHDMLGNAWQWVEDCWHDSYAGAPSDGSAWSGNGECLARVARGGSWNYTRRFIRNATRERFHPKLQFYDLGFRVARTVQ